jgi:hypothetical protein
MMRLWLKGINVMSDQPYSLATIFGGSSEGFPHIDLNGVTAAVSATTGQDAGPIGDAITNGLQHILSLDLGNVLGKAWSGSAQVKAALAATAKKSDAVAFVPLAPHKITSTHKPSVDLLFAGNAISTLPFDLVLSMDLQGVELEITDGRIVGAKSGILIGEGILRFSGSPILKANSPALPLPGKLKFAKKETREPTNADAPVAI